MVHSSRTMKSAKKFKQRRRPQHGGCNLGAPAVMQAKSAECALVYHVSCPILQLPILAGRNCYESLAYLRLPRFQLKSMIH